MLPQADKKLISLFDLPFNRIYVGTNDEIIKKAINKIKSKFESNNNFITKNKISISFYRWIKRKEFPLSELIKIYDLVNLNKDEIKKNISYIRTGYYPPRKKSCGSLSTKVPIKFPIKKSEELVRIISYLFSDGCVSTDKEGYLTTSYYNQSKKLREQFKGDICKVFNFKNVKEGVNKTTPYISLPTPISLILLNISPTFDSKKCRIPDFIKTSDKEIKKEFIKAFFDNEAHVRFRPPSRYIELTISNKNLLKEIKDILSEFGIRTTKISIKVTKGFTQFIFYIRNFDNILKYYREIGFLEDTKQKKLNLIIENPGRKSYAHGETIKKVIELLEKHKKTAKEIGKELNRDYSTIHLILTKLNKQRKVNKEYIKNKLYWELR